MFTYEELTTSNTIYSTSTVCGPWTGRKRRERVFLTTEEQ